MSLKAKSVCVCVCVRACEIQVTPLTTYFKERKVSFENQHLKFDVLLEFLDKLLQPHYLAIHIFFRILWRYFLISGFRAQSLMILNARICACICVQGLFCVCAYANRYLYKAIVRERERERERGINIYSLNLYFYRSCKLEGLCTSWNENPSTHTSTSIYYWCFFVWIGAYLNTAQLEMCGIGYRNAGDCLLHVKISDETRCHRPEAIVEFYYQILS